MRHHNTIQFDHVDKFKRHARKLGLAVRQLSTDAEDPIVHWYAGDDFWHFEATGGKLLPMNGYFAEDGEASYGTIREKVIK